MIFFLVSLLIAIFIGLSLVHIVFPAWKGGAAVFFKLCLGAGLGLGITSCMLFLSLLFLGSRFAFLPEFFLVILALGGWWLMFKKGVRRDVNLPPAGRTGFRFQRALAAVFYGGLLSFIISFALSVVREPHGKWDAWLIWNMHARFIFRAGEHWQDYFRSGLDWTHPDYPLMLPLSIVRFWKYIGADSLSVPIVLSFLFTFALVGLVVSSLAILRSENQGYLGGLVLVGSPFLILMGASQLADIPLAFFLLASIILFFLHDRLPEGHHPILFLAGVAAGLVAWTKNEGLLILLVVLLVRFFIVTGTEGWKNAVKQFFWLMAGVLPVLMVVVAFKVILAPPTDLFAGQDIHKIWDRLSDLQRYKTILGAYIQTGLTFTQGIPDIRTGFRLSPGVAGIAVLAVYLFVMGMAVDRRDKRNILCGIMVALITLACYFVVYLITPHSLDWHLVTSLNRLFLQVWPMVVFITFMAARTPDVVFPLGEYRQQSACAVSNRPGTKKRK